MRPIPEATLGYLARWVLGEPLKDTLPQRSWYTHRNRIRDATGIDIAAQHLNILDRMDLYGPILEWRVRAGIQHETLFAEERAEEAANPLAKTTEDARKARAMRLTGSKKALGKTGTTGKG